MPSYSTREHRAVLNVRRAQVGDRFGKDLGFLASYLPANDYGERYLYPGMILAYNTTDQTYFVPYNAGASYGAASDTAIAVLHLLVDSTMEDKPIIEPLVGGDVIEDHCYVQGGTMGSISSTIKTHLKWIQWV
jgi:hypothetical protein